MRIVIDTREQTPLIFPRKIETVRGTLVTGDYSVAGRETLIAVERKTVSDLHACVGGQRERFEREIIRLRSMRYAAIVVEGDLWSILDLESRFLTPQSVLGSIVAWTVDRVPVVPCDTPALAAAWTAKFLEKACKRLDDADANALR